jgi:hypothetical protein
MYNMGDREFYIAIRAAMIRRAKLLEQERATVLEEIAAIEQRFGITPKEQVRQVRVTEGDSVAGAVMAESRV